MEITIWTLLVALGILTAPTTLMIWRLQRTIIKKEKIRETKEATREEYQVILIHGINASLAIGEATAEAIRDGYCNGNVSSALEYAKRIKHEQNEFIQKQAAKNLN